MAQSFIGGASGTTSATIPAHQVGDLIIARAFRDGNNNAPTIPAGQNWTQIDNSAGSNSNGAAIAYKFATSTSEATGTWTSATRLDVGVWRGFSSCAAHFSVDGAASTTVNYKTVTSFASGSWAIAFSAHRSVNTTLENAPTGMTNRYSDVNATDEGAIHDTNGTVSSWSDTSVSVGGTSSGWRSHVIEAVPGAVNTTLAAGVGSYTITGTAASLKIGTKLTAAVGSYAITGTAATLKYGRKLTADVGSYVITGTAAALKVATKLTAAVGSYAISGVDAVLAYGRKIVADVGSYAISGTDATFKVGRKLTGAVGSYTITGTDATLTWTPASSGGWAVAINFRDSSGYATNAADETYCLGEGDTYPTVRNSMTFGWVSINGDAGRDRDNTLDRRLAGMNQQSNAGGTQAEFKIDLPSSGECDITLAIGDGTSDQAYQRVDVYDDTNLLFSVVDAGGTLAAHFDDANGTAFAAAAWPAGNVPRTVTFSTTICILKLGATSAQSNASTIAHIRIEHAGGANTTLAADSGSYAITGVSATLTHTLAPVANLQPGNYAEVFRPRLKKKKRKEIERAVEIATAKPPSTEQLTKLAEELVDTASPAEIRQITNSLMSQLDKLAAEMRLAFQAEKEREEREAAARKALILAALAAWEKAMEEDEMLVAYII